MLFLLCAPAAGQARLEGRVLELGFDAGLPNASVLATNLADTTIISGVTTDRRGFFDLRLDWSGETVVQISHVGFRTFRDTLAVDGRTDFGVITLAPDIVDLEEVEVAARRERMTINGDTVEFYAGGFYVPRYTYAESLVAALPGFEVIGGTVYYLGKPVDRVLIDGRAYFGAEVMEALQAMPIEMIETLQLYEQLPENRRFSGVDDGSREQVINLVTNPNMRRALMLSAGGSGGSADRFSLESGANLLDAPLQVSGELETDNTLNASGGGITRRDRARVSYNNTWNENTRVRMTVASNQQDSETESQVSRTYLAQADAPTSYDESRTSDRKTLSHTLSGSIRHTFGRHQLTFNPRLLVMENELFSTLNGTSLDPVSLTPRTISTGTEGSGNSLTGGFSADWQLNESDRWGMLASLNLSFSDDSGESFQTSSFDPTSSFLKTTRETVESGDLSVDASAGFMRVAGENGFLSIDFSQTTSRRVEDRLAFTRQPDDVAERIDSTLSNDHRGSSASTGVNLHYGYSAETVGLDLNAGARRNTRRFTQSFPVLEDDQRTDYLLDGSLSASRRWNSGGKVTAAYSISGSTPSGDELSRSVDDSNPLFLSVGNPDLIATIQHELKLDANIKKRDAPWGAGGRLTFRLVQNPVGTEVRYAGSSDQVLLGIPVPAGGQLMRSVNLDSERSAGL
ncbi:MAG: TonB-dependent receptor, partial [Rhodothermales bacterium]|nr:TonB-dependent receptor [Rhodothermales bacterium]